MRFKEYIEEARGKMVKRKCACCGKEFEARQADVNRGWGNYCSKSCKATAQEKKTGQYAKFKKRATSKDDLDDQVHQAAMDSMTDSDWGASDGGYHER